MYSKKALRENSRLTITGSRLGLMFKVFIRFKCLKLKILRCLGLYKAIDFYVLNLPVFTCGILWYYYLKFCIPKSKCRLNVY